MYLTSKRFVRVAQITLAAIFLVIVAGGVVRMTGSGMGCPDWPKCFEQYVPPTSVDQLPNNYKEIFAEKRKKKLDRFIALLDRIGFSETAKQLRQDDTILIEQDFNAFNTWTEYINRLVGALSGLLVFLTALLALFHWRKSKSLVLLCVFQVFLIGFQAWMGAMTVATNLTPWVLTFHMLIAILIIGIQLRIIYLAKGKIASRMVVTGTSTFKILLYVALLISVIQIVAGTGVRQVVDVLEHTYARESIVENIGSKFYFHRAFAWLVVLVNGGIFFLNHQRNMRLKLTNSLMVCVLIEALAGIGLTYLGLPAILQPIHLCIAVVMAGIQYQLIQIVRFR